jgi:Tol biopolymer transport system component/DNA-binding winged helix-turn-helix (wHTH) protein
MDEDHPAGPATLAAMAGPFQVGAWRAEPAWHRISRSGETRKLEPRVMRLLAVLAAAPGRPLTREQLLDAVWPNLNVNEDALSRAVSQLRRALSDDPRKPAYIETVHKGGYCLVAAVGSLEEVVAGAREKAPHATSRRMAAAAAALVAFVGAAFLLTSVDPAGTSAVKAALVPVPLTSESGREIDPAISRDGRRLAFSASTDAGYDLFWRAIGNDRSVRLTHDGRFAEYPAWSPGGDRIAFLRREADGGAIYIASLATGRLEKLVGLRAWSFGLDWSPDGRTIAYSDSSDGKARSIVLIDVATRVRRTITRAASWRGDGRPVFAPDGRRLAFLRDAGLGLSRIFIADLADPDSARPLTDRPEEIKGLDWDPAGTGLVYSARSSGRYGLWRMPAEGGRPQPIPTEGGDLFNPSISAQGLLVAEAVERDSDVWRAGIDGRGAAPLIRSTQDDYDPAHSPDRSRIVFTSSRSGSPELWLARYDGAHARQLTRLGGAHVGGAAWSPDGQRIAFQSQVDGFAAAYILSAGDRPPVLVAGGGKQHHVPLGWGRTAGDFFTASGSGSNWTVRRHDLAAGRAKALNAVPARLAGVAPDRQSVYLITHDGATLTRVSASSGRAEEFPLPEGLRSADAMRAAGANFYIFVPSPGGTAIHRLRRVGAGLEFDRVASVPGYGQVSVSSNETQLLFTSDRETANDIVLLRL